MMDSRVLRATPPNAEPEGEGRMKAFGSVESVSMRVLSPKILPFVRSLEGSMANTANLCPCEVSIPPNDSMKVLLPTPGTPVMPTRKELPECGRHRSMMSCAIAMCVGFSLSIMVIA